MGAWYVPDADIRSVLSYGMERGPGFAPGSPVGNRALAI